MLRNKTKIMNTFPLNSKIMNTFPLKGVANGTQKILGLGKFWSDLEISEAFVMSHEVSFFFLCSLCLGVSNFWPQGLVVSDFFISARVSIKTYRCERGKSVSHSPLVTLFTLLGLLKEGPRREMVVSNGTHAHLIKFRLTITIHLS